MTSPTQQTVLDAYADGVIAERAAEEAHRAERAAEAELERQIASARAERLREARTVLQAATADCGIAFKQFAKALQKVRTAHDAYRHAGGAQPFGAVAHAISRALIAALFAVAGGTRFGRIDLAVWSRTDAALDWTKIIEKTEKQTT